MNSKEIKLALKTHNPFVVSSVGDPWDNPISDVPDIYHSEFEQILNLIKQKQAYPKENFACLITGEAGSGKTHLISKILEQSKNDKNCSFAYIQPLENYRYPYNYLLREIITNLTRSSFADKKFSCRFYSGTLLLPD